MDGVRILVFVIFSVIGIHGYKTGAPNGVCISQHASHNGNSHQTSECPYKLTFSSPSYTVNGEVNVTIAAADQAPFKGFLVFGHRTVGDTERPVGEVVAFPVDKAKNSPCVEDEKAGVTHANENSVTSVTFTWKAPAENVGDVVFKHMIVREFETFWMGLESELLKAPTPLVDIPDVEQVAMTAPEVKWDECGVSKGCFLYPRTCSGSDCNAGFTYREDGDDFVLELYVSNAPYISVAFSHDALMGRDHVHACTGGPEVYSVQEGYNPLTYYIRNYRTDLSDMEVLTVDGSTTCRFRRPREMNVFTGLFGRENFTMDTEYYIFLAWGNLYGDTDAIKKHVEQPVISQSKINLLDKGVVRGSALPVLTQIHATLMLISWVLFVGMATVISRYYKAIRGDNMLFGAKYWFQIHRASGVLAWLLTAVSFVIIFVKVQALSSIAELHSYLGIAVMAVCTLQVIAGILRPGLDSNMRPVFNIGHWLMGKGCHILAAVTIFFAFYSDAIPVDQRDFGVISTSVWVALQFVWEAVFEGRKCMKASSKYQVSGDRKEQTTRLDAGMLLLYILCMAGILVALLLAIFLF